MQIRIALGHLPGNFRDLQRIIYGENVESWGGLFNNNLEVEKLKNLQFFLIHNMGSLNASSQCEIKSIICTSAWSLRFVSEKDIMQ